MTAQRQGRQSVRGRRKSRLIGLVLSGGGARGAYEAGVLKTLLPALAERRIGLDFISATSVGAVNACALAATAHMDGTPEQARRRGDYVAAIWSLARRKDVFRVRLSAALPMLYLDILNARGPHPWKLFDASLPLRSRLREALAFRKYKFSGLLDTGPLRRNLADTGVIDWPKIDENIRAGKIKGLALSATAIRSGMVHVFVQSPLISAPLLFELDRMKLAPVKMNVDHALASSAIPFVFPPVEMVCGGEKELFIDGGIRQNSPLLPGVILGAESLIVVGVHSEKPKPPAGEVNPSEFAPLLGKILNSFFLDPVRMHYGHFVTVNDLIGAAAPSQIRQINSRRVLHGRPMLREIRSVGVFPREDIGALAAEHWERNRPAIPSLWRFLLDRTVLRGSAYGDFLSYFYFEPDFLMQLVRLGEEDARRVTPRMLDYLAGMEAE